MATRSTIIGNWNDYEIHSEYFDRPNGNRKSGSRSHNYLRRVIISSLSALFIVFLFNLSGSWFFISKVSSSLVFYILIIFVAPVASGCVILLVTYSFCQKNPSYRYSLLVPVFTVTTLLFYAWYIDPFFPSLEPSIASNNFIDNCKSNYNEKTIEVVYTWVNVSDARWRQKAKTHHCNVKKTLSGTGDIDPFNALKYSMRSLLKNAGTIASTILIVAERDQIPLWLNISHPMIRIVFHDEFMPAQSVPVFNSNPTEYLLFRLKEAGFVKSNCFLYLNDDFFINRQLDMRDIIAEDGRLIFNAVIHLDTWFSMGNLLSNANDSSVSLPTLVKAKKDSGIFSGYLQFLDLPLGMWAINEEHQRGPLATITDPHVPYVINIGAFESFVSDCGTVCQKFTRSRCNRKGPMPMASYHNYLATKHPELVQFVPPLQALRLRLPWGMNGLSARWNDFLIKLIRPLFVYIQSHDSVEQDPKYVYYIRKYLDTSFPDPAPWELL